MENDSSDTPYYKKYFFKAFIAAAVIAGALLINGYILPKNDIRDFRRTSFYMDTYVEIIIPGHVDEEKKITEAMYGAFAVFDRLEKKYNYYNSKSLLAKVNSNSSWFYGDSELIEILKKAQGLSEKTGGAFDFTLGAVKVLYPFGEKSPTPPDEESIRKSTCRFRL